MAFVTGSTAAGGRAFRDPIANRARRGLGAVATDITSVGGAASTVVGLLSSLFGGGKDKTGLPQVPSNNASFNQALASKWYNLYLGGDVTQDPAAKQGLAQAITYWAGQIAQDGPQRAWVNFSGSPRNSAAVRAAAASYTPLYGDQYSIGPTAGPATGFTPAVTSVQATPAQVAAAGYPPGTMMAAPAQASMLGGLSGNTLLLLGGGLLVGLVLMKRGQGRSE